MIVLPGRESFARFSLGHKFRIRIELEKSTVLTPKRCERYALGDGPFYAAPKRFLRLAGMPRPDQCSSLGLIRNEPLNHFALAFWTLQMILTHSLASIAMPELGAISIGCRNWNNRCSLRGAPNNA